MPYSFPTYPEDLTGTALTNRILDESRVFTTAEERIFVPSGGPFYTSTMAIRNGANNQLLLPNTDYRLLHLHREGTMASGKTVVSIVHILNSSLTSVLLSYQNIGGTFSETASTVAQLLQDNPPIAQTVWGQIIGQPPQFAPAEHLHNSDELYGLGDVVSALEHLRMAILANDAMAIDAIYLYINNRLTDENYVTQAQLALVSGATRVRLYPTLAHLKGGTDFITYAGYLHVVFGEATATDNRGRLYTWSASSLLAENATKTVVIPNSLGVGDAGRYLSILRVEEDLADETTARIADTLAASLALSGEAGLRIAADNALQGSITALTTAVGQRALSTALNTEITDRTNADIAIAGDIVIEAGIRSAADIVLQGNITTLTGQLAAKATVASVTTEATTRFDNDNTLQGNITSEAGIRAAADTALQGSITTLTGQLAAKASVASVTTEAATRLANDNTLQGNIDGEATLRSQGDTALFDFMYNHGMMPDTSSLRTLVGGTDLDTVLSSGNWYLSAVGNYSNIPVGFTHGVLHMVRNDNLNGMQIIYGAEYEPTIWFRTREQDGGPLNADWGTWRSVATTADMATLIPTPMQAGQLLTSNGVTAGDWLWAAPAVQPLFNISLEPSFSGFITLRPRDGGYIWVAGKNRQYGGGSFDVSGLATQTLYSVFLWWNGTNLTPLFSPITETSLLPCTSAVHYGITMAYNKNTNAFDDTKIFLGHIYRNAGSFSWDPSVYRNMGLLYVRSYHHDCGTMVSGFYEPSPTPEFYEARPYAREGRVYNSARLMAGAVAGLAVSGDLHEWGIGAQPAAEPSDTLYGSLLTGGTYPVVGHAHLLLGYIVWPYEVLRIKGQFNTYANNGGSLALRAHAPSAASDGSYQDRTTVIERGFTNIGLSSGSALLHQVTALESMHYTDAVFWSSTGGAYPGPELGGFRTYDMVWSPALTLIGGNGSGGASRLIVEPVSLNRNKSTVIDYPGNLPVGMGGSPYY